MSNNINLMLGDCLERMRELPDNSVDSIVTDPPYGLSFMGKKWDYDVPSVEIWAECLRVLKPGGHLLAFAGTRTQHRMAVRIEDAGFEIRDMIAWVYSTGFPKSHNLDRLRGKSICGCTEPYTHEENLSREQKTECNVHPVWSADVSQAMDIGKRRGSILQPGLSEQGASSYGSENCFEVNEGGKQSGLEGWRNVSQTSRELRFREIQASARLGKADGSQRWVCDGASSSDGGMVRLSPDEVGMRSSCGPQSAEQSEVKFGTMAGQQKPQDGGIWPLCRRCGLSVLPNGLGTALKPALEPITVARKPLIGTVAENVLTHGTGAINVDACRVEHITVEGGNLALNPHLRTHINGGNGGNIIAHEDKRRVITPHASGRWPANLIHDGSQLVLDLFPETTSGVPGKRGKQHQTGSMSGTLGTLDRDEVGYGDSGSAARFFYCAKASKKDREEGNAHPTVKPTDLMRYLCRLVTQPGGVVLDPFMGSGSTGKAAKREGFGFIGIERDEAYFEIAKARINNDPAS